MIRGAAENVSEAWGSMADSDLLETAIAAARAGGAVLVRNWRGLPQGAVAEKQKNDFVTSADRDSEAAIIARIRERFPDDAFLGEEGGASGAPGAKRTWIIDPLDGTSNFVSGFPFWSVSIAARAGEEIVAGVVWDPLRDELYSAERGAGAFRNNDPIHVGELPGIEDAFLATGFPFRHREAIDIYLALFREVFLHARAIRRAGSAALDLALVAAGVFDGFFEFRLSPWDIAAGAVLIQEAGGVISDFSGGDRFWERGNVVAGCSGVARGIREIAAKLFREEEI
jgi:myo-inositol-1(or 4)-monophosphatase